MRQLQSPSMKLRGTFLLFIVLMCLQALTFGQANPAQTQAQSPLNSSGAVTDGAKSAQPTAPDSTKLIITHKEPAYYPSAAERDRRQGQVLVKMHIDEAGNVTEAEALSGDEMFRPSALKSARKWKFQPYIRDGKPIKIVTTIPFDFAFHGNVKDEPEPLSTQDIASKTPGATNGAEPAAGSNTASGPVRVRVAQGVSQGMLIHKVAPVYPPKAIEFRVSGQVVLQAVIGKDGKIKSLHPISGPGELVQSAMDAVQQWRYRPYSLNGEPVEVDTQITVNFTISR